MEQRTIPISRMRCPRGGSDPQAFTAEMHKSRFLLAHAEPAYPAEAIAQGIEGKVVLDVRIDRNGVIETLSVRTGHPLLAEAACRTVRTWSYTPVKVNGVPVGIDTDVEVTFTLPDRVASS